MGGKRQVLIEKKMRQEPSFDTSQLRSQFSTVAFALANFTLGYPVVVILPTLAAIFIICIFLLLSSYS